MEELHAKKKLEIASARESYEGAREARGAECEYYEGAGEGLGATYGSYGRVYEGRATMRMCKIRVGAEHFGHARTDTCSATLPSTCNGRYC